MAVRAPLSSNTVLVASLAGMHDTFRPWQFLSMTPMRAGFERLAAMLSAVRLAQGRSITAVCDICVHEGRVPTGDCHLVFATAACRTAWYAAGENRSAAPLASRQSSAPVIIRDPHLEMHIDGRCLLRCFVGTRVQQVQSRHVFSLDSMVAAEDISSVA